MERYATDTENVIAEVMEFIEAPLVSPSLYKQLVARRVNKGSNSIPVFQKTINILDLFFEPFLQDLAELLQDDQWLFEREKIVQNS